MVANGEEICVQNAIASEQAGSDGNLPSGFPFLVAAESREIIEPVLHFFWHRFLKPGRYSMETVRSFAWDLCDFLNFLRFRSLDICDTTVDVVADYRDSMLRQRSPVTGKIYAVSTVRRHLVLVGTFIQSSSVSPYLRTPLPSDEDVQKEAGHYTSGKFPRRTPAWLREILPRADQSADDNVCPLTSDQWNQVAKILGPLPSERRSVDGSKSLFRDRLIAELSLNTGLRRAEIASLTVFQIKRLTPHQAGCYRGHKLVVRKTKGGKKRSVLLPNSLLEELHLYINGEREAAIFAAAEAGSSKKWIDTLFLNHGSSRLNPAGPITRHSISVAFHDAVMAAGLTVAEIVGSRNERQVRERTMFRFHDLRHTYAMWWHQALIESGNKQPMKDLQARLGHKWLTTTQNTYLRHVDTQEADASDRVLEVFARFLQ